MHETMSGDINSLGHQLNRFSERNRHFRDFTLYSLISTLKEVIACFPVYRTYITDSEPVSEHDRRYIAQAMRAAKRRAPGTPPLVFDFVERLLLKQDGDDGRRKNATSAQRFIGKFQQITSPVAAKGIEDTALYVYNRLVSLNEVGGDPTQFGLDPGGRARLDGAAPAALAGGAVGDRRRTTPSAARTSARGSTCSPRCPASGRPRVTKWRRAEPAVQDRGRRARSRPMPNEEYLIYQTLVGAWPFDDATRRRAASPSASTRT